MGILNEKDALGDEEILAFSMTLVNKGNVTWNSHLY